MTEKAKERTKAGMLRSPDDFELVEFAITIQAKLEQCQVSVFRL